MRKSFGFFLVFLFLMSFSSGLFFLFRDNTQVPGNSLINDVITPIRRSMMQMVISSDHPSTLQDENNTLRKELRDQKKMEADMHALRDQYETEKIHPNTLLPATIIGLKGFVPGATVPDALVIDKGAADGIHVGQVAIYKDNVLGKIAKTTDTTSLIALVYAQNATVNAKTLRTNAIGLIAGQGQGVMTLQGVVLSEKLETGDEVLTKGEEDLDKTGYPPGLVIGKIVSVDKKASNLFQSAQVESLVSITKLTKIFIMTH